LFVAKLRDVADNSLCETANITTRTSIADATGSVLRDMAAQGFWPRLGEVHSIRARRQSMGAPSFGELRRLDSSAPVAASAPAFSSVMEANRHRLEALRSLLCNTFEEEWHAFEYGENLLASEPGLDVKKTAQVAAKVPKRYGKPDYQLGTNPDVEHLFPLEDNELMLSRLLRILRDPAYATTPMSELPYGVQILISLHGGIEVVGRYLQAGGIALVAAYTIVLLDTGFNVQPCDDLPENPFYLKQKRGRQTLSTISAIKLRASGKITLATLAEEDVPIKNAGGRPSSVEVIERWRKMTLPIRGRAPAGIADQLWILARGKGIAGSPVRYSHASFSDWWYQLMKRYANDPIVGELPVARRNIRPTVLQLRATAADLGTATSALVGNHSSLRTLMKHYLGRGWFKAELDKKIRHYTNLFEAALLSSESARNMGLDESAFLARQDEAFATGLGFACRDPLAGVQPGTTTGSPCTKLEACTSCPLVRFVPNTASFKDLVVAHKSLMAAEAHFVAANPARWAQIWLPLRAMVEATIELLRASHRRRAFEHVEAEVERSIESGDVVLLRVW
jgi:hypothetical protein